MTEPTLPVSVPDDQGCKCAELDAKAGLVEGTMMASFHEYRELTGHWPSCRTQRRAPSDDQERERLASDTLEGWRGETIRWLEYVAHLADAVQRAVPDPTALEQIREFARNALNTTRAAALRSSASQQETGDRLAELMPDIAERRREREAFESSAVGRALADLESTVGKATETAANWWKEEYAARLDALRASQVDVVPAWRGADLITAQIIIDELLEKPLDPEDMALRLRYLLHSHGLVEFVNEESYDASQVETGWMPISEWVETTENVGQVFVWQEESESFGVDWYDELPNREWTHFMRPAPPSTVKETK